MAWAGKIGVAGCGFKGCVGSAAGGTCGSLAWACSSGAEGSTGSDGSIGVNDDSGDASAFGPGVGDSSAAVEAD
jgi:hypothetical protein